MPKNGSLCLLYTSCKPEGGEKNPDTLDGSTWYEYNMPPEFIEFVLLEINAQLSIAMSTHDLLRNGGGNDKEVRLHDCYVCLARCLHVALDKGINKFFDPECKSPTSAMIGALFHDWCDDIIEDYQKKYPLSK